MEKRVRISLGVKTTIAIILIALLLGSVAVFISYNTYQTTMDEHYKRLATNVTKTAVAQLSADDIDRLPHYLETMEKDEAYERMLANLYTIRDNNDVISLYIQRLSDDMNGVYYIMDASDEGDSCELGEYYPLADEYKEWLPDLMAGQDIEPQITHTSFGWLVSKHMPIMDQNGNCVAFVAVDISMDDVMADRHAFLLFLSVCMLATAIVLIIIFLIWIRRYIVRPINQLAAATSDFVSDKSSKEEKAISSITKLDIHTGDEIENLAVSVKTMEREINEYIDNLTRVTAEKERIGAELNVATEIQASMLPSIFPPFPNRDEFDIFASMEPAKEVGGDFYDFFMIDDNHLGVVMADVSGKGVPAALFMVIAKTLIKNQASSSSPAEVFNIVNDQLCETNDAGLFVTAFMGILDLTTGVFTYSNAGHNSPLIYRKGQRYEWLKASPGFVLAGLEDFKYKSEELTLSPGDRLFLYTDGVTEALNMQEELFSDERLYEILNKPEAYQMSAEELVSYVRNDITLFADGAEQADDITMLVLSFERHIEG